MFEILKGTIRIMIPIGDQSLFMKEGVSGGGGGGINIKENIY